MGLKAGVFVVECKVTDLKLLSALWRLFASLLKNGWGNESATVIATTTQQSKVNINAILWYNRAGVIFRMESSECFDETYWIQQHNG